MSEDAQKSSPDTPILEGSAPPLDSADDRRQAMDQAFDYRGDVTIHTTDGRVIEGYVYDRREAGPDSVLRVMPKAGGREDVRYDHITRVEFTGRDTAAGRSWETWVKKYIEKKQAGQAASLEPEELE